MAAGYVPVDENDGDTDSIRSTHVTQCEDTIEQGYENIPVSASVLIGSGISLHPDYHHGSPSSRVDRESNLPYSGESDSLLYLEHHPTVPVRPIMDRGPVGNPTKIIAPHGWLLNA